MWAGWTLLFHENKGHGLEAVATVSFLYSYSRLQLYSWGSTLQVLVLHWWGATRRWEDVISKAGGCSVSLRLVERIFCSLTKLRITSGSPCMRSVFSLKGQGSRSVIWIGSSWRLLRSMKSRRCRLRSMFQLLFSVRFVRHFCLFPFVCAVLPLTEEALWI